MPPTTRQEHTTPHAVFLVHRARPGRRDEVHAVWNEHMAPAVEANADHLAYCYCFDDSYPDAICVFQLYSSADTAAQFLQQENYARYLADVEPLLTGPPELHAATPVWAKGLALA